MPRGVKKVIEYTGKAAKAFEKVQKLEADLKAAKEELKVAYRAQVKEEKAAAKALENAQKEELMKALKSSNKSMDEIMGFLNS